MSNKPQITVAGELREMTDEEYAQWLKDQENAKIRLEEQTEIKNKRQQLLDRLGITEEEAKLLLG